MLFLEGACLKTGFTKIMIDLLKKPMTYVVRGKMLQCGCAAGPSAADAEWCLARMACYVRSTVSVINAEFCDFNVLSAFSVFHLRSDSRRTHHKASSAIAPGDAGWNEKVSTLATAFNGVVASDEGAFQTHFLRLHRVALAAATEEVGDDNREAFRVALQRLRPRRICSQQQQALDGVTLATAAFLGWEIGTGDIERAFSTHQMLFCSSRRARMNRQREQDVLTLSCDYVQKEASSVIDEAIEIWKKLYYNVTGRGCVREGRQSNFGRPFPQKADRLSMKGLLRKRRREAEAAEPSCPVPSKAELETLTHAAWSPALAAEESHQKTKRARRAMEFVATGGHLAEKEMGGMTREEIVDIYEANETRLKAQRAKKDATKSSTFKQRVPDLSGKLVKWEPDALACSATTRALRLRTSAVARGADLVVVADLQNVLLATQWEVYLRGGAIASVDYIKSAGAEGTLICFKPAVMSREWRVWMSAAFALRFPREATILGDAIASPGSKWTAFAGNNIEFVAKALRAKKTMDGLVTREEFNAFPRDFANVRTAVSFLEEIRCIDVNASHVHGA